MKRTLMFLGAAAVSCALLVACNKEDTGTGLSGTGAGGTPDALVLARTFPPLLANGMDQIDVTATVVDSRGRALDGIGVLFATNHGTIEPYATTGNDGVAKTVLTSEAGVNDITATVTATASKKAAPSGPVTAGSSAPVGAPIPDDAIVIVSRAPLTENAIHKALDGYDRRTAELERQGLIPAATDVVVDQVEIRMKGVTLSLSANPSVIPADGLSTSQVTANLRETTSHVPLERESVQFGATAGTITGRVETNASGTAVATLTGLTSGSNSQITAFYGPGLTATTTVSFSALSMTLTSDRPSLTADGASTTRVVARLINSERNPVPGASVTFTTNLGVVTSPVLTDANGEAVATLTAPSAPGTATVHATFASATQTVDVAFTAAPVATSILLDLNPSTVQANGAAQSILTARVLDAGGNLMPDGTPVTFALVSGGGTVVNPSQIVTEGHASATYVAGTIPGPVVLRASSGAATKSAQLTLSPLSAGGITLAAGTANVLADGLASTTITATVTDDFGNPVAQGTAVAFQTSKGSLEEVTPTNAGGVATARLRPNRFDTGLARVTARAGDAAKTVDVNFVSDVASYIAALEVDIPSIGVQGTGSPQTAALTFEVRDKYGIPVDATHAATLSFSIIPTGGLTDATIAPTTATTNDHGKVIATVRSGIISGAIEVVANLGGIQSRPIRVAIHGDLPDPEHFSLAFERLNIPGLILFGYLDKVTAFVGDQHGNPVPDSTAVWFSSEYGLIQGSDFTDDHGRSTVDHVTAGPVPADGFVTIHAQTVAKDGNRIETSGQVLWTGRTILEITDPETFDVPNGGSVTIHYTVHDPLDHPLTGGTTINVSTSAGRLIGDVNVTLPDTQSGYTEFTVVLADEDVTQTDARDVSVVVTVKSPNGDATAAINGVLH